MAFRELRLTTRLWLALVLSIDCLTAQNAKPAKKPSGLPTYGCGPREGTAVVAPMNVTCRVECHHTCNCTSPPPCPPCATPHCLPPLPPAPPPAPPTAPAPGVFASMPTKDFKFLGCRRRVSWDEANRTCTDENTLLAVPKSMRDVFLLIGQMTLHVDASPSCLLHIGYRYENSDEVFQSVSGEPMNEFANNQWENNNPDFNEDDHRCVILNQEGYFQNERCDERHAFACEMWSH